jgi:hypothetical protein
MELAETEELEYLHDAVVTHVDYRFEAADCREILLLVTCNRDAGHPTWDGKPLLVRLHDLVLANHFVIGAVIGREQINSWDSQLSALMEAELDRRRSAGITTEGQRFSITFHSGSLLEGVCQRIVVESGIAAADDRRSQ